MIKRKWGAKYLISIKRFGKEINSITFYNVNNAMICYNNVTVNLKIQFVNVSIKRFDK